jgi:signal peptidase I
MKSEAFVSGGSRHWRDCGGLLLMLLLTMGFRSAWADWVRVPTGSMNPTVLEGDRLLLNKHAYGLRLPFTRLRLTAGAEPARGDVIVFDSPADGQSLVKRVVAIPGDTVELERETLIINGIAARYVPDQSNRIHQLLAATQQQAPLLLQESGLAPTHDIVLLPSRAPGISVSALKVPAGMYFVLGDNRDNSADSRYIGFVPRDHIVGRARTVVISFDPDHHYWPRSRRLLVPLI